MVKVLDTVVTTYFDVSSREIDSSRVVASRPGDRIAEVTVREAESTQTMIYEMISRTRFVHPR